MAKTQGSPSERFKQTERMRDEILLEYAVDLEKSSMKRFKARDSMISLFGQQTCELYAKETGKQISAHSPLCLRPNSYNRWTSKCLH